MQADDAQRLERTRAEQAADAGRAFHRAAAVAHSLAPSHVNEAALLASERAEAQRHALRRPQDVREPLFGSANGALPTGSQTASPAIPRPEIDGQVGRMNAVLGDIGYVLGRG